MTDEIVIRRDVEVVCELAIHNHGGHVTINDIDHGEYNEVVILNSDIVDVIAALRKCLDGE